MQLDSLSWFPGHMTKTRRMITAELGNVDAVCEILDARENITEYIEEIEHPTSPIPAAAEISEPAAAVHPSARTARNMWILKYAKESTRASIAAPAKVPAVRQAK